VYTELYATSVEETYDGMIEPVRAFIDVGVETDNGFVPKNTC
jgi:hypothetical protein